MVTAGHLKYEILPGEWYGPGTAAYVVRDLVHLHEQHQKEGKAAGSAAKKMFRVHVASQGGTVYRDQV